MTDTGQSAFTPGAGKVNTPPSQRGRWAQAEVAVRRCGEGHDSPKLTLPSQGWHLRLYLMLLAFPNRPL